MKKIAVVGGGITGLTAAYYLQKAGFKPLLFEAGKTPGGAIQTFSDNGYLVELGPNSLQETPEALELVDDLGLTDEVVEGNREAKNRYIVRQGELQPLPMSPPGLLRTPLLSWKGKMRLLREPFIGKRPFEPEESLANFIRRRLGQEVLDWFVNPFIAGIFAGDPEKLSARYGLPRIFELEQKHGSLFRGMRASASEKKGSRRLISFRNGLATLTETLTAKLDKQIYRETAVESIEKTDTGWQLIAKRFNRRLRDTYDAILLALPPSALAKIEFKKNEKNLSLSELAEIPHPPVVSVSLGFSRSQVAHPLDGFGMLLPEKEQKQILGTIFASTLFPNRAPKDHVLLTTFVGGTRNPDLANASEKTIRRIVLENLQALLGIRGEPVFE